MSGLIYVADQIACRKCEYGAYQNSATLACSYIEREYHSRTFDEKGHRRLPKGYCDKWKGKEDEEYVDTRRDRNV